MLINALLKLNENKGKNKIFLSIQGIIWNINLIFIFDEIKILC
jgi:hypothetical protein